MDDITWKLITDQAAFASNVTKDFFNRWSLIAGATLTLVVPYLVKLKQDTFIGSYSTPIRISILFIIVSLTASLLRNFVAGKREEYTAGLNIAQNIPSENPKIKGLQIRTETLRWTMIIFEYLAIFSYLAASILLIFSFIGTDLL